MEYDVDVLMGVVADTMMKRHPSLCYLENFRQYFYWDEGISAWVVLDKGRLDDWILEILDEMYEESLESREPSLIKIVLDLRERTMMNKIIRVLRGKIVEPLKTISSAWVGSEG